MRWLLLLHQIPPKPPYFRAKILRRLGQIGALPIKNSAYLLPSNDEALEDFEWLRREIVEEGGDAWLFRVDTIAGLSDAEIEKRFRDLRKPEYAKLKTRWRAARAYADRERLRKRFEEIRRIDYFGAPGREEVEKLMIMEQEPTIGLNGRTWVTRRGAKVDRIASAWLIRRFIDPAARFVFVDQQNYTHTAGELRFDTFEGEFTHQGDKCTFEVLLELVPESDAALKAIGEIVHDIDLKDSKFKRPETAGVAGLIDGIVLRHTDDNKRLEEGVTLLDSLHARLRQC